MINNKSIILLIYTALILTGVGCQQLKTKDVDEVIEAPIEKAVKETKLQADWVVYENKEAGFLIEHPEKAKVVVQGDGLFLLYEQLGPEDSPPPAVQIEFRDISQADYIQELFNSGPIPENIKVFSVTGGKEKINEINYFPEKGNIEYSCPTYFIEAEPRSVLITPWECFSIDYIKNLAKSFQFTN